MAELAHQNFSEFFAAVHNHEAFDWQKRLAKEVLEEGWPEVIRVPTSCGKTSVLDLAVFQLATQADWEPSTRTAARRICFLVDRRLVVDDVTTHARRLSQAIRQAANGGHRNRILSVVARRLTNLAEDHGEILRVIRLRGGIYRDDTWAADPLTPTILVSTVDQIGSRLLFRGYAVSARSRSVQAGLLAFDTHIILDEAHLSTVFSSTLNRIRTYQKLADESPLPCERQLSSTRMSATVCTDGDERVFELLHKEREELRLQVRLNAHKTANLIKLEAESVTKRIQQEQPHKALRLEKQNRKKLVDTLAEISASLVRSKTNLGPSPPRVIVVVVNRVATARQIFEQLRKAISSDTGGRVILLTGRTRPFDRDRLLTEYLPSMKAGREAEPCGPLVVVATQTIEVGANLDFDALITEAAPLDSLRQRFGRLDRLGRRHQQGLPSPAAIVIRSDHALSTYSDPIYGSAVTRTWNWLVKAAKNGGCKPEGVFADWLAKAVKNDSCKSEGVFDFSINSVDTRLEKMTTGDLQLMLAPQREDPLLFPAHLDAWVQTNPRPETDPDVGPFLHGIGDSTADVQLIWRADLHPEAHSSWRDIVALMPPRTREALSVPVYEVQRWLNGGASAEITDVEGTEIPAPLSVRGRTLRKALRWRGKDDHQTHPIDASGVRAGDTLLVPALYGGADEFGWNPESAGPVADVAEESLVQLLASYPTEAFWRPKLRLRLHPSSLLTQERATAVQLGIFVNSASHAQRIGEDPWPAIRRFLVAMRNDIQNPLRHAAVDSFLNSKTRPDIRPYPGHEGLLLSAKLRVLLSEEKVVQSEDLENDEPLDDESSFFTGGRAIGLREHTQRVEDLSATFCQRAGLNKRLSEAVRIASHWHDQGKRDRRFQAWLHGSELKALVALVNEQPLAKSGRDPKNWSSSEVFGYPRGSRHEFVSVRMLQKAYGGEAQTIDLAALLVGTHHGHGRALVPVIRDQEPVQVQLTNPLHDISISSDHNLYQLDSGWVDLFWRMVRHYGWWGLSYLEALLVTADRVVSRREQQTQQEVLVGR
jgi:CRISPR-associated endonuclease/helicase Cas3